MNRYLNADDIIAWVDHHGLSGRDVLCIEIDKDTVRHGMMRVTTYVRDPEHGGVVAGQNEALTETQCVRLRSLPGQELLFETNPM